MSESYIAAEIDYAIRAGVEVEVWRRRAPSNPGPVRVPLHEDRFEQAMARVRPDVVHFHWLKTAVRRADAVAKAGLSLTVRGHWHFDRDHIDFVSNHPAVHAAYMYPHALRRLENPSARLKPLPVSYNSAWYRCAEKKDLTRVVRTSAGKRVKDLAIPSTSLLAVIRRGREVFAPRGGVVLESGDRITFIGEPGDIETLYRRYGVPAEDGAEPVVELGRPEGGAARTPSTPPG